ncbi:hypothetical protein EDD18DRAFT_1357444 [Armillaria luteobubalina]|uniref:Uncharacterized protein n=1 Tax=Armillaria luteobubalina TaxID=153913 RepID=A0AA39UL88_9AGAR|nr:hypothetical protein EDD18DRAFT_1357444 [Armillaria luteobubalina]
MGCLISCLCHTAKDDNPPVTQIPRAPPITHPQTLSTPPPQNPQIHPTRDPQGCPPPGPPSRPTRNPSRTQRRPSDPPAPAQDPPRQPLPDSPSSPAQPLPAGHDAPPPYSAAPPRAQDAQPSTLHPQTPSIQNAQKPTPKPRTHPPHRSPPLAVRNPSSPPNETETQSPQLPGSSTTPPAVLHPSSTSQTLDPTTKPSKVITSPPQALGDPTRDECEQRVVQRRVKEELDSQASHAGTRRASTSTSGSAPGVRVTLRQVEGGLSVKIDMPPGPVNTRSPKSIAPTVVPHPSSSDSTKDTKRASLPQFTPITPIKMPSFSKWNGESSGRGQDAPKT